jgi:hypothetical protein
MGGKRNISLPLGLVERGRSFAKARFTAGGLGVAHKPELSRKEKAELTTSFLQAMEAHKEDQKRLSDGAASPPVNGSANEEAHPEGGLSSDPKIRNSEVASGRDRVGEISSVNVAADHGGTDGAAPTAVPGPGRVPYRVAGKAGRQALTAAAGLGLTNGQWKVLAAVVSLTALYSKLEDPAEEQEIADLARLGVRQTRRVLSQLHTLELITWKPRRGRGRSTVELPPPRM